MTTQLYTLDDQGNPVPVSPEAQAMADEGAHAEKPTETDIAALLKQMTDLQNRVTTMQEERGIPTDPVEFWLAALREHVKARENANANHASDELNAQLANANTNLTGTDAELLALRVDDLVAAYPAMEGGDYLRQLAREVRKAVLVKGGKKEGDAELALRGVSV